MTFTQIVAAITGHCGLSSTEATTRVGASVNRHYRRITASLNLNAARFVTRSQTTTNGQQYVTFTEIEKIDRILDTTDATSVRLLTEVSIHQQRSTQPGESEPNTWALRNTDADSVVVLLDTVPQTTYSLQADGWTTLTDLSGSDEPVFPESYHDILTFAVISEEYDRKEKDKLAARFAAKSEQLLAELRHFLADSPTELTRQRSSALASSAFGSGGGGGNLGGTAYTQSSLLTFDLGPGVAPFAVAQATAAVVTNLDADKLDGQHGSYYLDRANHTGSIASTALTMSASDRLVGRDTASGGASEEISVTGGIEFSGSGSIRTTAFTGDVTKTAGGTALTVANDAVTYAKMQNVSAASRVLGRGSASGAGDPEELTVGSNLTIATLALNLATNIDIAGTLDVTGLLTLDAGQIAFPASQNASSNVNTLDDYEEGTWQPTLIGTGGQSGQAYTTQVGSYIKIGKTVVVHGRLTMSTLGTVTTAAAIGNLPFTSENTSNQKSTAHIGNWANLGSSLSYVSGVIEPNTTRIELWGTTSAASLSALTQGNLGNTSDLVFSAVYRASA